MEPLNLDKEIKELKKRAKTVSRRNRINTKEDKKLARKFNKEQNQLPYEKRKRFQSNRYYKAIEALKIQYQKIINKKDDYENKQISSLINSCDGVALEDCNFKNMSKQVKLKMDLIEKAFLLRED
jgi:hypothetical protein